MGRLAWLIPLFSLLGCGDTGSTAAPTSAFDDARMVREASAQLRLDRFHIIALGLDEISVPPSVFGTQSDVVGKYAFVVAKDTQGKVRGAYRFSESVDGVTTHYAGVLTCVEVYDFNGLTGNRAKIGGRVDSSDDPTIPVGTFIWWQAIDNHSLERPDQSTLTGFGDEAANTAFCASPNPPRFGPFDVIRGNITVLSSD
jgi:hypothetical protein